jgi:hypothetical protein
MDVRRTMVAAVMMAGACGAATNANATLIADSISEFSGTQGANGWFYGWVLPTDPVGSFRQMNVFDGDRWYADPEHSWTMLGPIGGHANGEITSGGRIREEQWAVRRWVSDVSGDLDIEVTLRKLNINPSSNGVVGMLLVDGQEVWRRYATGTDAVGSSAHVQVSVALGSRVDFVLDPFESNDWSDNSQFSAKVTSVPGPAAMGLVGVAVTMGGRRRRQK